ncbi:hypothetical protein D917_02092 [Trichinella nativa]|uniref:Uncharacterized protein n=1 Tax=Trichinella nativa TaxID=6335 RepID=A0A1Y3EIN2_9BILA|nr:hypothetical protein D917_02092 [Trichinella nativa]
MQFKISKSKTGSVVHIAEVIITAADAAHESIFNIVQRCTARSKLFYVVFPEYSPSEVYAGFMHVTGYSALKKHYFYYYNVEKMLKLLLSIIKTKQTFLNSTIAERWVKLEKYPEYVLMNTDIILLISCYKFQLESYHSLLCTCLLRVHNRIYNSKDSQMYRNGRADILPN